MVHIVLCRVSRAHTFKSLKIVWYTILFFLTSDQIATYSPYNLGCQHTVLVLVLNWSNNKYYGDIFVAVHKPPNSFRKTMQVIVDWLIFCFFCGQSIVNVINWLVLFKQFTGIKKFCILESLSCSMWSTHVQVNLLVILLFQLPTCLSSAHRLVWVP